VPGLIAHAHEERLRKAEQRIEALRPYAGAIRRMTRQAAEAAQNMPSFPILQEHESESTVGILLVTGDRGLAGAFNSQIIRAGVPGTAMPASDMAVAQPAGAGGRV
jgi:F0F1-type ATP synthase gamma subunit